MTTKTPDVQKIQDEASKQARSWWSGLRAATRDVRIPEATMPAVRLRDVKLRSVKVPDVKLPEVTLSGLQETGSGLVERASELAAGVDWAELPTQVRERIGRPGRRASRWPLAALAVGGVALSGLIGAFSAYLLDPERGKVRRMETADRLAAAGRMAGHQLDKGARAAMSAAGTIGEQLRRRSGAYDATVDQYVTHPPTYGSDAVANSTGMAEGSDGYPSDGQLSDEEVPTAPGY